MKVGGSPIGQCMVMDINESWLCLLPGNCSFYTGMDKTSLDTSSGTLFVRDSGCPDVHVTSDVITYHCSA